MGNQVALWRPRSSPMVSKDDVLLQAHLKEESKKILDTISWNCEVCLTANQTVIGQFNCINCDHYQFPDLIADPDPSKIVPEECKEFPKVYHQDLRRRYYRFQVTKHVQSFQIPPDVVDLILLFIESAYCEGDKMEVQNTLGKWDVSVVRKVSNNKLFVHYEGWSDKWDEWIEIDSERLAPLYTHTNRFAHFDHRLLRYKRIVADTKLLTKLVRMGFTEVASKDALCATENHLDNAIERLSRRKTSSDFLSKEME